MIVLAKAAASGTGAVLLIAGGIVLAVSLGRLLRKRRSGSGGGDARGPGRGGAGVEEDAIRRLREAADRELVRLEERSRDARAEIETKVHVMNQLLLRAEKVIGRLDVAGKAADAPELTPPDPRFAEVYRLADDGLDAASIAGRTEFERGEIELILGLRARRESDRAEGAGGES